MLSGAAFASSGRSGGLDLGFAFSAARAGNASPATAKAMKRTDVDLIDILSRCEGFISSL
jgi:hypothetical protein